MAFKMFLTFIIGAGCIIFSLSSWQSQNGYVFKGPQMLRKKKMAILACIIGLVFIFVSLVYYI